MACETLKLSEKGSEQVKLARRTKKPHKTLKDWCKAAYVSLPTLKRFIKGQAIREDNFKALCEAINLEWKVVADLHGSSCQGLLDSVSITVSVNSHISDIFDIPPGLFMLVGTFTDETQAKVKVALRLLGQILQKADIKPDINVDEKQCTVTVIGSLPDRERAKAEAVLRHLKKLLLDCDMTPLDESESFTDAA